MTAVVIVLSIVIGILLVFLSGAYWAWSDERKERNKANATAKQVAIHYSQLQYEMAHMRASLQEYTDLQQSISDIQKTRLSN